MLEVLAALNAINLIGALVLKYGKLLGKGDLLFKESDNIDILLGLTGMIFLELVFVSFDFFLESYLLIVRLLPTVCEYLFVFRMFNRYLLFFHSPPLRRRVTIVMGGAIACRVMIAYFYTHESVLLGIFVVLIELTIATGFVYASSHKTRHFSYIAETEVPKWENEHFEEDIEGFKIGMEQRNLVVYASNSLQLFILNGSLWLASLVIERKALNQHKEPNFDIVSLVTRIVPHMVMVCCYFFISFKYKDHIQKDKTFAFELKERLTKPEI